MNLGENIYQYRMENNLSQSSLADALEVSRQSVSKWENNSAMPELDKLVKMSQIFHITLDELVFGENTEAKKEAEQSPAPYLSIPYVPMRTVIGVIMLLFGMVFFLLSIFWGHNLYFGEEVGEFASVIIVLLSVALLGAYSFKALTICAATYILYSIVSFGILDVVSITNYLFVGVAGWIILFWFIRLGLSIQSKSK